MDLHNIDILLPALVAGILVLSTHVPLGRLVLERGIVFIDLAIAQVAGLGVVAADFAGFEPSGRSVQAIAALAALAAAAFLVWTERRFPTVQEAIIGVVFVVAASAEILLLNFHPHGAEQLKDLLVGQILWVTVDDLVPVAALYAALLAVIFLGGVARRRVVFYAVFALAVTASVQLVGIYLVFASLILPALAARRLGPAYAVGVVGYVVGLAGSLVLDLPTGAAVVCALALVTALFVAARAAVQPAR